MTINLYQDQEDLIESVLNRPFQDLFSALVLDVNTPPSSPSTGDVLKFDGTRLVFGTGGGGITAGSLGTIIPEDYGAIGDGIVDDTIAIQNAANAAGNHTLLFSKTYKVTDKITLSSGTKILMIGATITQTTAGKHIFEAVNKTNLRLVNCILIGTGSSTVPTDTVGGYSATETGLISLVNCTNVEIVGCEVSDFYNGINVIKCTNVMVHYNYVHNWYLYGTVASLSIDYYIDYNRYIDSDASTNVNSYAVSATGDAAGGNVQKNGSISFNTIRNVTAWDGIMTHDCDGLRIEGNDIRNVRHGIDVGHFNSANIVKNVVIKNNYIEATTVNTWGANPAVHAGIGVYGYDSTHLPENIIVEGNTVRDFYTGTGFIVTGNPASITVWSASAIVIGNKVINQGDNGGATSAPGIYLLYQNINLIVNNNAIEGLMGSGGIRVVNATAPTASIVGNSIKQTNTAHLGIYITGSTLPSISIHGNTTNSTTPFATATSTVESAIEELTGVATGTFFIGKDVVRLGKGGVGLADLIINQVGGQFRIVDSLWSTVLFRVYEATGNVDITGNLIIGGTLTFDGSLGTGLVKHTTGTGALSIAVGGDLPSHTHVKSDISDFAHTHAQSDVTNLVTDLAAKAPVGASYVVIALDATLSSERVLTGTANRIALTDGGANGNITLDVGSDIARRDVDNTMAGQLILRAGTSSAGTAPLEIQSGTLNTTAEAGAVEYDGTAFYGSVKASARGVIVTEQFLSIASGTVSFPNNASANPVFASANDVLNLEASTSYFFEGLYEITGMGATTRTTATLFGGTATITNIRYYAMIQTGAANALGTTQSTKSCVTATANVLNATATTAAECINIRGIVRINAAGTFIPQVQHSADPTGTIVVQTNSYFRIYPIGSNTVVAVGNYA